MILAKNLEKSFREDLAKAMEKFLADPKNRSTHCSSDDLLPNKLRGGEKIKLISWTDKLFDELIVQSFYLRLSTGEVRQMRHLIFE